MKEGIDAADSSAAEVERGSAFLTPAPRTARERKGTRREGFEDREIDAAGSIDGRGVE